MSNISYLALQILRNSKPGENDFWIQKFQKSNISLKQLPFVVELTNSPIKEIKKIANTKLEEKAKYKNWRASLIKLNLDRHPHLQVTAWGVFCDWVQKEYFEITDEGLEAIATSLNLKDEEQSPYEFFLIEQKRGNKLAANVLNGIDSSDPDLAPLNLSDGVKNLNVSLNSAFPNLRLKAVKRIGAKSRIKIADKTSLVDHFWIETHPKIQEEIVTTLNGSVDFLASVVTHKTFGYDSNVSRMALEFLGTRNKNRTCFKEALHTVCSEDANEDKSFYLECMKFLEVDWLIDKNSNFAEFMIRDLGFGERITGASIGTLVDDYSSLRQMEPIPGSISFAAEDLLSKCLLETKINDAQRVVSELIKGLAIKDNLKGQTYYRLTAIARLLGTAVMTEVNT